MEPLVGQWLVGSGAEGGQASVGVDCLASKVQLTQLKHWQCCAVVDGATCRPVTSGQWCWGWSGLCWSWLYHSDCSWLVRYSWHTVKTLTVLHNGRWFQPGSLSHRTASFYSEWIGHLIWQAHFNTDTDSAPCGCGTMGVWHYVGVAPCGCGTMWVWHHVGEHTGFPAPVTPGWSCLADKMLKWGCKLPVPRFPFVLYSIKLSGVPRLFFIVVFYLSTCMESL